MAKALVALLVGTLALTGCEKDPNDAQTWLDKLGDRSKQNDALRHLEHIADPTSIKPLGEIWKAQSRQSALLRSLIVIAGRKDPKTNKSNWADALPYLIDAVENFDQAAARSIDDAMVACDALGRSGDPQVIPTLIKAADRSLPNLHPGQRVRIACTRALGNFHDARVAGALMRILQTASTDKDSQAIKLVNAAAALSLAESGDPQALPALIDAMYFKPAIFQQIRQAVTRVGKPAVPVLLELLQEKNAAIAKKAKENDFDKKGPGNLVYKAALLLGDMRVKEAVPLLTAALKTEPRIAFYDERSGAPGPTTHDGILGALRLIMDPAAAAAVKNYWSDPKTYDGTRPTAIDVYSMLATDDSALGELLKYLKDEKEEQPIRLAAIIAYGRLARTAEQQKVLAELAQGYDERFKKADEKLKAATKDDEKASLDEEKQLSAYWRDALNESRERIGIAVECNRDPACYVKALPPIVKDFKAGGRGMPRAERALLELGKMGETARAQTDALLAGADTTERFVRQAILLALPRLAALPCTKCADRLNQIIEKQSETSTLDFLTGETRIVYHYFLWAGK